MLTLKRASCLTLSVLATLALGTACSPSTTKTGAQPLTTPGPGGGPGAPGVGSTTPWGTGSSSNPISSLLNGSGQAAVTSAANVTTYHNDTFRTGQQNAESVLTPGNVTASTFGKIGSLPVQGYVAAQPLWVTGVQVPGSGPHDLLFVATEHDQVYAFDTNDLTAGPVWQRNFLGDSVLPCPAGAGNCRTLNFLDMAGAPNVLPEAGITATPVIDTTANAIYIVAQTVENGIPYWKIHSLNLSTGAELANSPVEITGTVNSTGPGSVGGQLTFDPVTQLSRTGLALDSGIVYFGASSFDDQEPAHGWVFAYDTTTGALGYYVSTPHEGDGNVWMGGGAPAVDTDHTLFVTTGNGDGNDYDAPLSSADPDDAVIHLGKLTNGSFGQLDFFQPYNHTDLATRDVELGSGGVLLIPADTAHTAGKNLLFAGGKQATMYLLNRAALGGVDNSANATNDPTIVQELIASGNQTLDVRMGVQTPISKAGLAGNSAGRGFFSTASYYNGNVYIWNTNDTLRSIPLTNGFLNWANSQSDPGNYTIKNRGATMTISSNSGQNGVLWAIDSSAYKYSYSETPPVYGAGCIVTAGSADITGCNTLASMTVGMTVFGAGIPVGTTVASIDTTNFAFTLSQNAHDPFLDNNSEASGDVIPLTYYAPGTAGANFARIVTAKPDPTGAYSTSNITILDGAITGAPVVQFTYDWSSSDSHCALNTAVPALPGSPNTTICQSTDVWAYEPADYAGTNATANVDYTMIPFTNEVSSLGQSSLQTTSDSVTGLPDYIETTYWISSAPGCYPGTAVSTATDSTAYCQTVAITPITKVAPAVLLAYDPTSLTKIYESDLQGAQPGSAVKFTVPTVANGMVFVGTGTEVSVFGLFNPPTQSVTITNSASFIKNQLAPGALATIFSTGLTTETASATVVPLTDSLGTTNTQVFVNGTASAMLYISPSQINFQIPPTTAVGMATVQVYSQGAMTASTQVPISQQAIGIFTATNPNTPSFLNGVVQYYTTVNGKVTASPAFFTAGGAYPNYTMLPISLDPSLGTPYLEIYATGLNASPTATDNTAAPKVLITSGGVTTTVTTSYAGQQHTFAGLDQVNVQLPANLTGTVTVQFPSGTTQPPVQMEITN